MAHAQKPNFVFRRNGRVHLNRRGRQFSRLLAAEVCASAVVMLDTPCSLHSPVSPSLPLPCVTVCHHISAGLYDRQGSRQILLLSAGVSGLRNISRTMESAPLLLRGKAGIRRHSDPPYYLLSYRNVWPTFSDFTNIDTRPAVLNPFFVARNPCESPMKHRNPFSGEKKSIEMHKTDNEIY